MNDDDEARTWIARIRALPDLLALAQEQEARSSAGADRYALRDALRAEYEREKKTFVWSTPYRTPPAPCSTGEHEIPSINREILIPGKPHKTHSLLISERNLHEIEVHGRKFSPDQVRKLEAIFD